MTIARKIINKLQNMILPVLVEYVKMANMNKIIMKKKIKKIPEPTPRIKDMFCDKNGDFYY